MKKTMIAVMLSLGVVSPALTADKQPMVSIGQDGKLEYAADERGNRMIDFSRCGYMGGGVKLPDVPVRKTLSPGDGKSDDTARIQKALDDVGQLKPDRSGFRGALLLKRGTYRVAGSLQIKTSGVVLRGAGQGKDGTVIIAAGTKKRTLVNVGSWGKLTEVEGSRRKITDTYVPWGVRSFNLESTKGLSVGNKIIVCRPGTKEWIHHIGMDRIPQRGGRKTVQWTPEGYTFHFERVITAIKGNRIALDAPVVNSMEDKWGGGYVYLYKEEGRISQVAVEQLRLVSEYKKKDDEEHGWTGVSVRYAVNAWVRNVTAVHFGWGGVSPGRGSKFVTVQDCSYLKPVSQHTGGRRYPYQVDGQFCLVQRCFSEGGRHCNVAGARSCGPNAYLDCYNVNGDSGPHHRWAMGALYDNMKTGSLVSHNRGNMGTGHGWIGAQIVFWNCQAGGMKIERPPTAELYVIGCSAKGNTSNGHFESHGKRVQPRSLYLKQLEERLGKEAVENITTEAQRKGIIYDQLKAALAER